MLTSGTLIAHYEIVSLLGAGGMGEVYRARDTRLNRTVALKVLPPEVASDPGRRQRFEQEARSASALNHPNIISVFDAGTQEGLAYIVSELIPGESLREIILRGPIAQSRLLELAGQIADALAAAHAAGIVHRDLKPENIMVTRDGRVKVLDFGLAKQVGLVKQSGAASTASDETAYLTRTAAGAVLGTAAYMSPEQVRGNAVDPRSDIFSFGLVLHESIAGRPPFERDTAAEVMTAILREDPPELPESTAPALRQIVAHCLEKEPERRFHSARDLAFALRTVAVGTRSSGQVRRIEAPRTRKWLWPAVSAALAALLISLAIPHFLELEPIDLAAYRFTPFATGPEPETEGVWSPDGKSIAYVKRIAGIPQLMVRGLDSPSAIQLTKSQETLAAPFWAPDSSLLYYVKRSGNGELWAISPAGGQPSRILNNVGSAAVSPDGKALAIWRLSLDGPAARASVWISSPPGATPRPYQPEPFAAARLADSNRLYFSPDGASILLTANVNGAQLWLLPFPDGGVQPRRLFADRDLGLSVSAGWLPGNRYAILAFDRGLNVQQALWLADLKAEKLRKLTAAPSSMNYPSVAPGGRQLVLTANDPDYDGITLPLDGSAPQPLMPNIRDEMSPAWSPQGDQVVYATNRNGEYEIWIRNLKAALDWPVVTRTSFPPNTTVGVLNPVFSADGSRFAFVRYASNEPVTIWVAPTVGGAPIRLTREQIQSPTWSPDGSAVAGLMHSARPWQPAIVGVGADMKPHLVPGGPSCNTPPDWSPTGNWIACESAEGVQLFKPDGSAAKTLPKLNSSALAFARDGNRIFAVGREAGRSFLKSLDISTGTVRTLADYGPEIAFSSGSPYHLRLSLSPDGKSLATSAVAQKSELWLLEGYPLPRPWWRVWK